MHILFDGDDELFLSDNCIQNELDLEDVVRFYGTTLIYYKSAKAFVESDQENWVKLRLGGIRNGLESLLNRLIHELGQDQAMLVAARIDMNITLCE